MTLTKFCMLTTALFAANIAMAQQPHWLDPQVNAVNRAPMHTSYFAFQDASEASCPKEESSNFMSINGMWKFNWVRDADMRPTDFFLTDFNDKGWDSMPVPGVWELNGYGDPLYLSLIHISEPTRPY